MSTSSVRVANVALVAILLSSVAPLAALAGDTVVGPDETVSSQIELNGSDSLTVEAGGAVDVAGDPAVYVNNSDSGGVTLTNSGTIASSDDRAIESDKDGELYLKIVNTDGATISGYDDAIKLKAGKKGVEGVVTIENSGTIISTGDGQAIDLDDLSDKDLTVTITNAKTGVIQSTAADALRPGGATVINYGEIVAYDGADSKSDGIDLQGNTATIRNYGLISGAHHGITTDTDLDVTNEESATIIGRNGSGVGSDGDGTVTNYGTITGTVDNVSTDGDGDGVDIDGLADITNYGTIQGTGAKGEKDGSANTSEGIAAGGGSILNLGSSSRISGAGNGILIDDSDNGAAPYATYIANEGTIAGLNGYGIRLVGNQDDEVSNSGTISGANGLALDMGGGNDTLTAVTGSLFKGTIDGGDGTDTLNLDGFEQGSIADVKNFEVLNVAGGDWTLVGDQNYSRNVDLSAGSLAVAGTLDVGGDFTQLNGAAYTVTIDNAGATGLIKVAGTATLAGTVVISDASGLYTVGTSYTILTAGNTIATTFDDLEKAADLPFLTFSLSYGTNAVSLDVSRSSVAFADIAATSAQRQVGAAVEGMGSGSGLYNEIASLSTADARTAFAGLSGEAHASTASAMALDTADLRSIMNGRVRTAFGNVSTGAIGTHGDNPDEPLGLNVWGKAYGSIGTIGRGGSSMDRSSAGVMAGADMAFGEVFRLGLAAGYGRSFYDVDDLASSSNSRTYTLATYGGAAFGPMTFSFGAANTWHDVESTRGATIGATTYRPQASYDARTLQVFGEADYAVPYRGVTLDPYAGLAYVGVHTDGYTETTAAGLTVKDSDADVGFTTLGLRLSSAFQLLNDVDATLSGGIGWRHAFGDVDSSITAAFSGGNSFTVSGTPIADDAALVEAGLDITVSPDVHVDVSYSGQFADDSRDHSFAGRLSVRF
ncbi:outer membrane autotransporter protein [Breoghania corrubedonensis]|uniref:Outer membrane autotransporter protein n=1 Tax=Breoghania corrubedonensis TaxID=665038 RepID=A0A2T5VFN5_9HYPH|nr:autotransporter domain-containing protein [Breoghania corrubedonensis]PTW62536.1 outer membrane autotransporter protein [Breoghania corrubedonensis]